MLCAREAATSPFIDICNASILSDVLHKKMCLRLGQCQVLATSTVSSFHCGHVRHRAVILAI
ncbi:hypothetical protein WOLCODRAFT_144875 [Wolfiporia cocos MD-104 SS10]|uniref:Uncharacterized protein n=1 Tax=Wolfiporia cocos (strain MD-104) TaxID=742152 RepID=A0A2H3JRT7_WOLCO|nr:hypothetical protein WOLCODRAFT_144875 [Wolfiporia cocos MD-104 SS10]